MVCPTTCQLATDVLLKVFIPQCLIESNNSLDTLITHLIDCTDSDTDSDGESYAWDETLSPLNEAFLQAMLALYASRYINPHVSIPKTGHLLWILLNVYKTGHEAIFQTYMRIWPRTFDSILDKISGAGVFHAFIEAVSSSRIMVSQILQVETASKFSVFALPCLGRR